FRDGPGFVRELELWCHVILFFPLDSLNFLAILMVSRLGGHHVLPHQVFWIPHLSPGRREPLGGRALPATSRRNSGTARAAPRERPTRRPARLGSPTGPLGPAALRTCPRQASDHLDPAHRPSLGLPTALAADRLPACDSATSEGPPLRVSR